MARFILDVGNLEKEDIKKVIDEILNTDFVGGGISTIYCIDETNENQFYTDYDLENGKTNYFSEKQLETFKKVCDDNM